MSFGVWCIPITARGPVFGVSARWRGPCSHCIRQGPRASHAFQDGQSKFTLNTIFDILQPFEMCTFIQVPFCTHTFKEIPTTPIFQQVEKGLIPSTFYLNISSASRKKGLILGRLRPFQFPQKGHLN